MTKIRTYEDMDQLLRREGLRLVRVQCSGSKKWAIAITDKSKNKAVRITGFLTGLRTDKIVSKPVILTVSHEEEIRFIDKDGAVNHRIKTSEINKLAREVKKILK